MTVCVCKCHCLLYLISIHIFFFCGIIIWHKKSLLTVYFILAPANEKHSFCPRVKCIQTLSLFLCWCTQPWHAGRDGEVSRSAEWCPLCFGCGLCHWEQGSMPEPASEWRRKKTQRTLLSQFEVILPQTDACSGV